ncbi:MAG: sel1 repeat family protein [Nitrospira sp.]|jgi:TPR repeat protein|nr:sel1 repeat family protein [Nitrospira sp.]
MYAAGNGIKQDDVRAATLYRKACDDGDAKGCINLGVIYQVGRGVKSDDTEALKHYGKACDLREQKGCSLYAKLKTGRR